jgi:hypothetical protein
MDIKTFLENSVYYPACGFDATPIKYLGKMFSNFVYADFIPSYYELDYNISKNGLRGYYKTYNSFINAEELFGMSWKKFIEKNKDLVSKLRFEWEDPFAKIYSFGGANSIHLLYIKSEGISAYKYLYSQRDIAPKCLVTINPGLAFGGNFSEYPGILTNLIKSTGKFPEYQFYDTQFAREFYELRKSYHVISQYDCPERKIFFTLASMEKEIIHEMS